MKNFAIVTLLVLAMASSVFSQAISGGQAREAAMGGSQAGTGLVLNPFIMNDPSLMFINPAYQANYHDYGWSNIAGGNIAGTTNTAQDGYGLQNAGISFSLNSDWNVGAILSYDPSAANAVSSLIGLSSVIQRGSQNIPAIRNAWEVVVSTHTGPASWGFGLMYGSSNSDLTQSNVTPPSRASQASSHVWGFRLGLIDDLGNGNSFDASASMHLDKATDNIDYTPPQNGLGGDYSASGTEYQINARGKFKVSSKFNFVPIANYSHISTNPQEDTPPFNVPATKNSDNVTFTEYALGVGGEYRSGGVYVAGGLSWVSGQLEWDHTGALSTDATTQTAKYTAIPVVNLGAEWSFLDWLVGRAGYFRYNGNVNLKSQTVNGTTETNNTQGQNVFGFFIPGVQSNLLLGNLNPNTWDGIVTLGLGFKFGAWAMDATVSDEALRRGLGLIGGGNDNINTFGYITASYNFSE